MISGRSRSLSLVDHDTVLAEKTLVEKARDGDEGAFGELAAAYRGELRRHCYRMLGSAQDAEDAVQDALLRAWRSMGGFEGRASVRSWLYSIATNTALDITRRRSRRELPVGFGPAGAPGDEIAAAVTDPVWLEPCPDSWLAGPGTDATPEARYERRESVELAFLVMLQRLAPLQRAVLILRDVLGFPAAEVSAQLGTSLASVNSALQRARAVASAELPPVSQQAALRSLGSGRAMLLARRYADALEAGDADALVGMLTADGTWSMPPHPTWFRGHDAVRDWLVRDPLTVRWRHLPTVANGQLAVGCYLDTGGAGRYLPWVIDVLTLSPHGREIAAVTGFIVAGQPDPAGVFATFGLPPEMA